MELEMAPKTKRAKGEVGCEPLVYPDVQRDRAQRMATIAKALADPVRIQLVEVLRKHAGNVCVRELVPLVDVAQPTLPSRHGTRGADRDPRPASAAAGVMRPEAAPRGQATR